MVLVMCIVGSFAANNRIFDVWTLLLWGVLGFVMNRFELPLTPIIMGFILGPICEKYLRRGLMMSQNDFSVFFTRKISGAFLILAIAMVVFTFAAQMMRIRKQSSDGKGDS